MGSRNPSSGPPRDSKAQTAVGRSNKLSYRASNCKTGAFEVCNHDITVTTAVKHGRYKRAWKACERCRMKKSKCNGGFPCERCEEKSLVCTPGARRKTWYKQLPPGYEEVLKSSQMTLIATIHSLYRMVRSSKAWELGEPGVNARGQPVIHHIAQKLGCIRPNCDTDLLIPSVFSGDKLDNIEQIRKFEEQQHYGQDASHSSTDAYTVFRNIDSTFYGRNAHHASLSTSPEVEQCCLKIAFAVEPLSISYPQGFVGSNEFGSTTVFANIGANVVPLSTELISTSDLSSSGCIRKEKQQRLQQASAMRMPFTQQPSSLRPFATMEENVLEAGLVPTNPSSFICASSDVMIGMTDPMICESFNGDIMEL